jgi:uncharacterized repeat protein (TIGR02543 family)
MSWTVTYAANGATSGAVPVDATAYAPGATVTVLGNTGTLARTGYTFLGWNTAANSTGFFRAAAATFTINADTTLYAQWQLASLVTIAQLKAYARKLDGDTAGEALYQTFLDAAERIVDDYLGYTPALATHTETLYGDGKTYLALEAPVIGLTSVTVDGVSKTVGDYTIDGNEITEKNGNPFGQGSIVVVVYSGGFATIPPIVTLTILRIASILTSEGGENIGVTSQTFDGGNTRTFINYTNFAKYLAPLAPLRVVRMKRAAP